MVNKRKLSSATFSFINIDHENIKIINRESNHESKVYEKKRNKKN